MEASIECQLANCKLESDLVGISSRSMDVEKGSNYAHIADVVLPGCLFSPRVLGGCGSVNAWCIPRCRNLPSLSMWRLHVSGYSLLLGGYI